MLQVGGRPVSGGEQLLAAVAEGECDCPGEHGVARDAADGDPRAERGDPMQLGAYEIAQPGAARPADGAGQDDEVGVEDGDDRGQADGHAGGQLDQEGACRRRRGRARGTRRSRGRAP